MISKIENLSLKSNSIYFVGIGILFVISLIYSRFAVSLCIIGLCILAIKDAFQNKKGKSNNSQDVDDSFSIKSFISNKAYAGLLLVFICTALSGINSSDLSQWVLQMKLKLPFLVLPFAFYILRPISERTHNVIHLAFIGTILTSTFQVGYHYFTHFDTINAAIDKGQSMPTPIDHIHYAIMLAYAVSVTFVYGFKEKVMLRKLAFLLVGLYLFAFVHLIAVRTGIALAYIGVFIAVVHYVYTKGSKLVGLLFLVLLICLPFLGYKFIPSLHHKINYMFYDIKQFQKGEGQNYSDSERLMSYEIALELIKERPIGGHGIADLKPIMKERHMEKYGQKEKYIYPHNQYLYILVSMGIIGSLVFFYGLFCPFVYSDKRNIFLVIIFALLLFSFLVENTIQRAVITAFFLFFILINMSVKMENKVERIS